MQNERIFREESDVVKKNNPYIEGGVLSGSDLPSSGLFYPANFEISYRLFSFGELKFLSPKVLDEKNVRTVKEYIDMCLKGIHFSHDFNPYDLCWYDFIYISILRKFPSLAKNLDDPYDIATKCPHCAASNISALDLDSLEFNSLETVEKLSVEYNGEILKFKPMTIGKYFDLIELSNSISNVDMDIAYLAGSLISDLSIKDAYTKLYEIQDRKVIEALFKLDPILNLGLMPHVIQCQKCQEEYSISLQSSNVEYSLAFPRLI